ncbi:hypothetical protein QBC38DRAFT_60238 [Podospora fimiseda]|uniref:Uncharacterized protein n=1 Tax=Podospora fimiseda TaxID=252190 RepID=A0AAN7GNF4_9PEZI|nr:hypothetical protein QBC38DRAFT_60238 [Podospora fimiseda]
MRNVTLNNEIIILLRFLCLTAFALLSMFLSSQTIKARYILPATHFCHDSNKIHLAKMSQYRRRQPAQPYRGQAPRNRQRYQSSESEESSLSISSSESSSNDVSTASSEVTEEINDQYLDSDEDTSVVEDTEENYQEEDYDDDNPQSSVQAFRAGVDDYNYDPRYYQAGYDPRCKRSGSGSSLWDWIKYIINAIAFAVVNVALLAVIVIIFKHMPKIMNHFSPPPLDVSNFRLYEVTTAHDNLVASLDPFNRDPDVDRTLRRHVFKLIKLEKDLLEYPLNTKDSLAQLLESTILLAHQYYTFSDDVGTAINTTIQNDEKFLSAIETYKEAKKEADDKPSGGLGSLFSSTPEGILHAQISDILKSTHTNIEASTRSADHLKKTTKDVYQYYRKLNTLEKLGKDHLQDPTRRPPGGLTGRDWVGPHFKEALKHRDRLFNIKDLRGLRYVLEEIEDLLEKADGNLVKARNAVDKLAVIGRIDPTDLVIKYHPDEMKKVFTKARQELEKARARYAKYHPDAYRTNWEVPDEEAFTALKKWTTKAGVGDKFVFLG